MFEIEDLPKGHSEIQEAQTRNGPAYPAGGDEALQTVETGLTGRIEQKVVVAPVAQPEKSLRNPWQKREHDANFQAKDNVENDAEFGGHLAK